MEHAILLKMHQNKIKIIYFQQVMFIQEKGNYKEEDPLKPWNNYAWSKLRW